MCSKKIIVLLTFLLFLAATGIVTAADLLPREQLGKNLFLDTNLSTPPGQSCAACHATEVGFTGPDSSINAAGAVYPGAVLTRFGNRKPPSAAYAGDSPVLYYDDASGMWVGGMFWDGRATGWTLGDPLAEQAQGPFLNPLEQNNPNARLVCLKVQISPYAGLFEEVWGLGSLDCVKDVAVTYERIARSIAAYERSEEVNPFSSKFDLFWDAIAGEKDVTAIDMTNWNQYTGYGLDVNEVKGLALFNDKTEAGGKCSLCHVLDTGTNAYPLFTDFTYDNLGVPKNSVNPFYSLPRKWNPDGMNWIDYGLGGFLKSAGSGPEVYEPELGKHKVPTLRNVDKRPSPEFVKAYGHNGYFKSLEEIVNFYNTRDVETWPPPEVNANMNTTELGDLGLSPAEEDAIVAFLKTLSDGYKP